MLKGESQNQALRRAKEQDDEEGQALKMKQNTGQVLPKPDGDITHTTRFIERHLWER